MTKKNDWDAMTLTLRIMADEIEKGNDRTIAIVLSSLVDDLLKQLLQQRLLGRLQQTGLLKEKKATEAMDRLFQPDRPLGTFSARTDLCLAMGLIGPIAFGDLNYIRQVRNRFAHFVTSPTSKGDQGEVSFKTRQISDWCKNLGLIGVPEQLMEKPPKDARQRFKVACINLIGYIQSEIVMRSKNLIKKGSLGEEDRPFVR